IPNKGFEGDKIDLSSLDSRMRIFKPRHLMNPQADILKTFQFQIWIMLLVSLILVIGVSWILEKTASLGELIFFYVCTLCVSAPIPSLNSSKVFFVVFLWFLETHFVRVLFQSEFTTILSHVTYTEPDILRDSDLEFLVIGPGGS